MQLKDEYKTVTGCMAYGLNGMPTLQYCKWLEKICDDQTDRLIKIEEAVNGQD